MRSVVASLNTTSEGWGPMAVADATSASGAIGHVAGPTSPGGRGPSLTTPAQFRLAAVVLGRRTGRPGPGGRAGRLGPGRRRHGGGRRRHAAARGRRGALRRAGRRRCRRVDGLPPRRLEPPDLRARYRGRHRRGERLADQDRSRARPVSRVTGGHHPHRRDPAGLHRQIEAARTNNRLGVPGRGGVPPPGLRRHAGHHPARGHQRLRGRRPPALRRLRRRHVTRPPRRLWWPSVARCSSSWWRPRSW